MIKYFYDVTIIFYIIQIALSTVIENHKAWDERINFSLKSTIGLLKVK